MERLTLKQFKETYLDTNFDKVSNCHCLVVENKNNVIYGEQNDFDFEYCKENGIPTYEMLISEDCIVLNKGSAMWFEMKPNSAKDFYYTDVDFMVKFVDYLKEKGLNAVQENNYILVDDYVVAVGFGINLKPDYRRIFSGVQVCWKCDVELINKICTKTLPKTPKGLYEYGITQEEIIEFIENYFDKCIDN